MKFEFGPYTVVGMNVTKVGLPLTRVHDTVEIILERNKLRACTACDKKWNWGVAGLIALRLA